MSKMGPQVERRFERRESRNVIVVKSTAQPSEIINILCDVRASMYLMETTEKMFTLATAQGYANTIQNVPPDSLRGLPSN